MVGWWRADLIPGATEGALIGRWPDQSGNGLDLTQSNDANKPTYLSAGIGGRPTVRFADTTVAKSMKAPAGPYTAVHMVFVFRYVADGFLSNQGIGGMSNTGNSVRLHLSSDWSDNVAPHELWVVHSPGGERIDPPDELANLQTAKVFVGFTAGPGGTMTYRYNGVDKGSRSIADPTPLQESFFLGAGTPQYDFAEVILYNRVLSSGEVAALESYLTQRYG
jgi:hypothetical protein